jgi:hypothetical protein
MAGRMNNPAQQENKGVLRRERKQKIIAIRSRREF